MRAHTANEMRFDADILAPDGATVLAEGVGCNVEDLTGRRLEQAQLSAPETSHMILMRAADATTLTAEGFVRAEGVLYVVDYLIDPRNPRPYVWVEVYAHAERTRS